MTRTAAFLTALASVALLSQAGELWTENAKEAMAQAAKEKKDLLIDFTGSDWCGVCVMLDKEVFSQPAFADEAPKHFVLLKLDFPRAKPQSPELQKQNAGTKSSLRRWAKGCSSRDAMGGFATSTGGCVRWLASGGVT